MPKPFPSTSCTNLKIPTKITIEPGIFVLRVRRSLFNRTSKADPCFEAPVDMAPFPANIVKVVFEPLGLTYLKSTSATYTRITRIDSTAQLDSLCSFEEFTPHSWGRYHRLPRGDWSVVVPPMIIQSSVSNKGTSHSLNT